MGCEGSWGFIRVSVRRGIEGRRVVKGGGVVRVGMVVRGGGVLRVGGAVNGGGVVRVGVVVREEGSEGRRVVREVW